MGDVGAMNASMKVEPDLALFREDLDALKRDVASLIDHMKGGATNTVQNAAGEVERSVSKPRPAGQAEGNRSAKALHFFVQNQPFLALTIAVGIVYVGGRVLGRSANLRLRATSSRSLLPCFSPAKQPPWHALGGARE